MFKKSMFKGLLFLQIIFLGVVMISCGAKKPSVSQSNPVSSQIENKETAQFKTDIEDSTEVAVQKTDKVPIYPGCESLKTELDRKKCMSKKVQNFVLSNFDTNMGEKYGIHGSVRVVIKFEINKDGDVTNISAEGSHPKLEKEGIRVVSTLPYMIPAEFEGKKMSVNYTLPIEMWFK